MTAHVEEKKQSSMYRIVYGLFFIAVGCIVILLILSKFSIPGVPKVFVVQSGSMEPAIKTGSVVITQPQANYAVGDVITYMRRADAISVTHRIESITSENGRTAYITKGDANNAADTAPVPANIVVGKVLFSIPFIGYAVAAARMPYGFLIIVIVPALFILYDEVVKITREVRRLRMKKRMKAVDTTESN